MKKWIAILIVLTALIVSAREQKFTLNNYFAGDITYYSHIDNNGRDLGFCYINKDNNEGIIGESIIVEDCELNSLINSLRANVVSTEWVAGECIVYAYTSLIPTSVELFDDRVNIQIAYNTDRAVVGWPLILGDY